MNNTIKLPNGRIFDLTKDDLTTEDYRSLSGVEVRHIRKLQEEIILAECAEKSKKYLEETGLFVGYQ